MSKTLPTVLAPTRQIVQNDQLSEILAVSSQLTQIEKKHWLALIMVEGIGPIAFYYIVNYLKKNRISWSEFWMNKHRVWSKIGLSTKIAESIKKCKKEQVIDSFWETLQAKNVSVVSVVDKMYPSLLKQIVDSPPILFVKGDLSLCLNLPIAVVGTRKMTAYGKMVTRKIVKELVINEATIISGFMYGVDVMAQQTALENRGVTVGVLGYGFDHIYPGQQRQLMEQMLQTGRAVFISEYPPFIQPTKGTFPRRNRIIAGLSLGVVVTESGSKSGTQITVSHALDYGRDVFAVSGPITSPYHEGVKQMLNQGAMLVGSGNEILNNLSARYWDGIGCSTNGKNEWAGGKSTVSTGVSTNFLQFNHQQRQILKALAMMPLSANGLANMIEADPLEINQNLIKLELKGILECEANQWQLVGY